MLLWTNSGATAVVVVLGAGAGVHACTCKKHVKKGCQHRVMGMGRVSSSVWLFLIYINEMEKRLSLSLSLSLARVGYGSMRNLRFGLVCVFFIVGASSWNTFFSVVAVCCVLCCVCVLA